MGLALAVVAVTGQTAMSLVNGLALDSRFDGLNADHEGNIFTWASASATFAAAFAALVHAVVFRAKRRRFVLVAALAAFFSLDDIAQVHENVGWKTLVVADLPRYFGPRLFVILYIPLLAVAALLLWRIASDAGGRIHAFVAAGLALLGLALTSELLASLWFARGAAFGSVPDVLEVALEEGAELGGWILLAAGLTALLYFRAVDWRAPSSRSG